MANTELHIIMDPAGNVSVTGPLDNVGVCYMMLEQARDVIHYRASLNRRAATDGMVPAPSKIIPVNGAPPLPFKR